jgi:hypothetical protein
LLPLFLGILCFVDVSKTSILPTYQLLHIVQQLVALFVLVFQYPSVVPCVPCQREGDSRGGGGIAFSCRNAYMTSLAVTEKSSATESSSSKGIMCHDR